MTVYNTVQVCILNLDGSDWSPSSYGRFRPTETAPGTVLWDRIPVNLGSIRDRNTAEPPKPVDCRRNQPKGTEAYTTFVLFFFFGVLLTVHLSIILAINQLNAQNLVL